MSSVSSMHWFRVNVIGQENSIEDSKRTEKKWRVDDCGVGSGFGPDEVVCHSTFGCVSLSVLDSRVGPKPPGLPGSCQLQLRPRSQHLSEPDFCSGFPWPGPPSSQPCSGSTCCPSPKEAFLCWSRAFWFRDGVIRQ